MGVMFKCNRQPTTVDLIKWGQKHITFQRGGAIRSILKFWSGACERNQAKSIQRELENQAERSCFSGLL